MDIKNCKNTVENFSVDNPLNNPLNNGGDVGSIGVDSHGDSVDGDAGTFNVGAGSGNVSKRLNFDKLYNNTLTDYKKGVNFYNPAILNYNIYPDKYDVYNNEPL